MVVMNKTNEYNYIQNQVNIRIRIRIRDIHFVLYPTISESVSVSELKCGKKCYPDPIPCVSDPIPSLLLTTANGWLHAPYVIQVTYKINHQFILHTELHRCNFKIYQDINQATKRVTETTMQIHNTMTLY